MMERQASGTEASLGAHRSAQDDHQPIEVWVAALEFAAIDGRGPILFDEVRALIHELHDWDPSGLWSSDRYAIQLQVPARSAHQAVQWALAYHGEACLAADVPVGPLLRVEVSTLNQLERSWDEDQRVNEAPSKGRTPPMLCDETYLATRKLLSATTPAQVMAVVLDFVTAVGGQVEPGALRHVPDLIAVPLDIDGDQAHTWYATAETLSVAGLVIEQSLPLLLGDARLAVSRLRTAVSEA